MANISELRDLPWLFEGDHKGVGGPWYGEFSKKFMEIAFLNAVSFPFTLLSPVVLWKLQVWFFTNKVKSQRELNELMTLPPFLLSERYGQLIAQVMYSSSSPRVCPRGTSPWCCSWCSLAIDRVMLLRYCANPRGTRATPPPCCCTSCPSAWPALRSRHMDLRSLTHPRTS